MGIDESKIKEAIESFKKAEEDKLEVKEKEKIWKILTKHFVHGIASLYFSLS